MRQAGGRWNGEKSPFDQDLEKACDVGLALELIKRIGGRARTFAEEQAARFATDPVIAEKWRTAAATIPVLLLAGEHMEIALNLLDSVGETSVPPRLDGAIVALGVRSRTEADYQLDEHVGKGAEMHFRARAQRHLDYASSSSDPVTKALHLNLASRYATLRELA